MDIALVLGKEHAGGDLECREWTVGQGGEDLFGARWFERRRVGCKLYWPAGRRLASFRRGGALSSPLPVLAPRREERRRDRGR